MDNNTNETERFNSLVLLTEQTSQKNSGYIKKIKQIDLFFLLYEILVFLISLYIGDFLLVHSLKFAFSQTISACLIFLAITLVSYRIYLNIIYKWRTEFEVNSKTLKKLLSLLAESKDALFNSEKLSHIDESLIELRLGNISYSEGAVYRPGLLYNKQRLRIWPLGVLLACIIIINLFIFPTIISNSGGTRRSESTPIRNDSSARTLKMAIVWDEHLPILSSNMQYFCYLVDSITDHKLQIEIYKGLLPDKAKPNIYDYLHAVETGNIDILHSSAYYWMDEIPGSIYFSAIPFGKSLPDMERWLYREGGYSLWSKLYQTHGIIPFECGNTGYQTSGWYKNRILSAKDFKSLHIRFVGLGKNVLESFGATCEHYLPQDIMLHINAGELNAAEFTGYYDDEQLGLDKLGWYQYQGWQEKNTTFELIINEKTLNSLPDDLKAKLTVAVKMINKKITDEYLEKNDQAKGDFVNENISEQKYPPAVFDALRERSLLVRDKYIGVYKDFPFVQQIDSSYKER